MRKLKISNQQKKDKKDKNKDFKPERRGGNAIKTCYHCRKTGHIQSEYSGSGAHATPHKDLTERSSRLSHRELMSSDILEMADKTTGPTTAAGKVDIPTGGGENPIE
ncbi:hypothetical protein PAAG_12079 [Paracoccidioides lutzii Pb01]|uniref:Uncharacterized protein n=1 Tax=Paracoccidioides lutzii (strain ATCC MYA-826 / Pb01) TaxID=502779 RepID=A0A0A2V0B6_PARBA|nr:hypothetical protein PAAG_12079 [Paracoccidioides lutzii Pb01]KGQ01221.1 hypothetical protein PAAG_12079 [Paracoccidioides lutzii Pb01]